jgi:hypothetical protein
MKPADTADLAEDAECGQFLPLPVLLLDSVLQDVGQSIKSERNSAMVDFSTKL